MKWPLTSLNAVFSTQTEKLIAKGYCNLLGISRDEFLQLLTPLRNHLQLVCDMEIPKEHLPLLIVATKKVASLKKRVGIVSDEIGSEEIIVSLCEDNMVSETERPNTAFYLVVDVETGEKTKIQFPKMGAVSLEIRDRHALTVDEGFSLLTQESSNLSFEASMLFSGSCYTGWGKEKEIPFARIYTGEFDYGVEVDHTMHKRPHMTPSGYKMFWKTPSCRTWLSEDGFV